MYLTKEKNCYSEPKIGPKNFDKLKPEPSQALNARPDLQLWCKEQSSYHIVLECYKPTFLMEHMV